MLPRRRKQIAAGTVAGALLGLAAIITVLYFKKRQA